MIRPASSLALAASMSLALAACAPPWTIIRQAAPNPLVGRAFVLTRLSFDGLTIDSHHPIPEGEYLARKTPSQREAWELDKARLESHFVESIAHHANGLRFVVPTAPEAPDAFVVHTRVTMIEPGSYFRDPECHMEVQITSAGGSLVDHVVLRVMPGMGVIFPVTAKLERMGDQLGDVLTRYLRQRSEGRN